jgi:hypothetical protein
MAINIDELLSLPAEERSRIAELLWSSIHGLGEQGGPVSPEHQREIDVALEEQDAEGAPAVSYEELTAELLARQHIPR